MKLEAYSLSIWSLWRRSARAVIWYLLLNCVLSGDVYDATMLNSLSLAIFGLRQVFPSPDPAVNLHDSPILAL